jgi:stage V sporulation protein SpoVS
MRDHGSVTIQAVGSLPIYVTHQALSISRLVCIDEHEYDFQVIPTLAVPKQGSEEGRKGVVATFSLVKCAPRTTRRRRPIPNKSRR